MRESLEPALPLRTPRLDLRLLGPADRAALLAYRSLPHVCRYLPFPPMDSAEIDRRLAGQWQQRRLSDGGSAITLGIEVRETGLLVGDVVLFVRSRADDSGEVGWVLSPEHTGHGYATEAAAALLALGFEGMGMHRVIARMDPANDASARVAARLGMRVDARLTEKERVQGERDDTLFYALVQREWRALHP